MKFPTVFLLLSFPVATAAQEGRLNGTIDLLESGEPAVGLFAFDMSNGNACIQKDIPVGSTSGPIEVRIAAGETFVFGGQSNAQLERALELTGRGQ